MATTITSSNASLADSPCLFEDLEDQRPKKRARTVARPPAPHVSLYSEEDLLQQEKEQEQHYTTIYLTQARILRCIERASSWSCATKRESEWQISCLGAAEYQGTKYDNATFVGGKGEHAMAMWLQEVAPHLPLTRTETVDTTLVRPNARYDMPDIPTVGATTEIKTTTGTCFSHGLIPYDAHKGKGTGLSASYYVFCKASVAVTDLRVDLVGWISRDKILQEFAELHEGKRGKRNYHIPFRALSPMSAFSKLIDS